MDEIVALMIGLFIANYKPEEHIYITSVVKAFLIGMVCLVIGTLQDYFTANISIGRFVFTAYIALAVSFVLTIFFCIVEFLFKDRK